ncbi:hypothetical protein L1887_32361 [Cichorium endivia]|nr:hypothetical protein L1887_32361 [Cichorium endivia]
MADEFSPPLVTSPPTRILLLDIKRIPSDFFFLPLCRRPNHLGLVGCALALTKCGIIFAPDVIERLLGKGGSVVADMRKVTGAVIKIVGDNQVPKCARETDQLVLPLHL